MNKPIMLCPQYLLRAHDVELETDTCVLVEAGRILAIGSEETIGKQAPDASCVRLPGSILMPGFVNSHQHGRGISQIQLGYPDQRLELWMAQRRSRGCPDLRAVGLLASAEMLRNGVTCAVHADLAYGTGDYEGELRGSIAGYDEAGLRACIAIGVCDQGKIVYPQEMESEFLASLPVDMRALLQAGNRPPYAKDFAATSRLLDRLMENYSGNDRIGFCYGPSGPTWVSDELFRQTAEDAGRRGINLHIHALETIAQFEAARREYPEGTIRHLRSLGAISPRTVIAHGVFLTDDDIAVLAEEGASVATNPGSNIRLCDATARVYELINRGVSVGVGSDNSTIMDDEDLFSEARLASRLVPRRHWDMPHLPTGRQVVQMLTESGAKIAGFSGCVGRIEKGWFADLTAMSVEKTVGAYLDADMPLVDALIARGRGSDVRLTMVGGRILYHDGVFPHLDIDRIRQEAGQAALNARLPPNPDHVSLTERLRPHLADFYRRLSAHTRFPDALS